MLFGRQKNLNRRAYRPDESFHRERRRKGAAKATMLELTTGKRPKSIWSRVFGLLFKRGRD